MATLKETIKELLNKADVKVNASRPWDITVHNDRFYSRLVNQGTLGAGESYMDGDWDCDQIDIMLTKVFDAHLDKHLKLNTALLLKIVGSKLFNQGTRNKSKVVAEEHYNLGNDIYEATLDKWMMYTCGYWKDAKNIDQAQEAKMDLICRKLAFKKGMKVLDIGGGWGGFAKFAAQNYGVSVVNISISKEQLAYADEMCKGLPVENRFQDYRDVNEKFDRIVSICMFEHVGYKNYRLFMELVHQNLKEDGMFLIQTIMGNKSQVTGDRWILKYIFPNSMLASIQQIGAATEGLLIMEDWHNFGPDYDKTLLAWYQNFEKNWPKLKEKYSERFYRMWRLYLLSTAASFRVRKLHVSQIVFSKSGVRGGYESIR